MVPPAPVPPPQIPLQTPQFANPYGFPGLTPWPFGFMPPGYPPFAPPMFVPPDGDAVAGELLLMVQQESSAREQIVAAEASEIKQRICAQYMSALEEASRQARIAAAAQKGLERARKSQMPTPTDGPWVQQIMTGTRMSPEATLAMLMGEEASATGHSEAELEGLLPPSLSEGPFGGRSPPPEATHLATRGFTSLANLDEAEDREKPAGVAEGARRKESPFDAPTPFRTPLQRLSQHQFTPTPASSSSSPGITPSPPDRLGLNVGQSPLGASPCFGASPCTTLTFAELASPHPSQGKEQVPPVMTPGVDPSLHPWPASSPSPPPSRDPFFCAPIAGKQLPSSSYFRSASQPSLSLSVPAREMCNAQHPFGKHSMTPPVSPSNTCTAEEDAELELEMSKSLSDTLATLATQDTEGQ